MKEFNLEKVFEPRKPRTTRKKSSYYEFITVNPNGETVIALQLIDSFRVLSWGSWLTAVFIGSNVPRGYNAWIREEIQGENGMEKQRPRKGHQPRFQGLTQAPEADSEALGIWNLLYYHLSLPSCRNGSIRHPVCLLDCQLMKRADDYRSTKRSDD